MMDFDLPTPGPERRTFTPTQRLAAEVLRQAFMDLESWHGATRDDALAWFACDGDGELALFAFPSVCAILGLDRRNIRAAAHDPDRRRTVCERLRREWNEGARK